MINRVLLLFTRTRVFAVRFSGGHTTEIIRLMGGLSQFYNPRHYVIADTDQMSEEKIRAFEAERKKTDLPQVR